LKYKPQ